MIAGLKETVGILRTTISSDESKKHVYEICREFDTDGEEAILLTLYPTLTEPNTFDLSSMHLMNHVADEELQLQKVHFVFLFSKVIGAKPSTRGLTMDCENMEYIRELITQLPNAKIIISFGSSMAKCPAVIESKVELFKMIQELRPKDALWQISTEDMDEEAPHILYAGIRFNSQSWSLRHYVIPHKYTEEGYKEYLANKEIARVRFMQNVLGKKRETETEMTEEKLKTEEKPKKGKKKHGSTES